MRADVVESLKNQHDSLSKFERLKSSKILAKKIASLGCLKIPFERPKNCPRNLSEILLDHAALSRNLAFSDFCPHGADIGVDVATICGGALGRKSVRKFVMKSIANQHRNCR